MPNITIIPPREAPEPTRIVDRPKRKVAAYARVSTEKEEQLSSYEAQLTYYANLIRSHSDWEFVGVYADEGITGTSASGRPGFQAMLKDAKSGLINLIITKSISRFARNTVDSLTSIRELKSVGTEIFFEKENIWTFDNNGELLITILSSLAQEESRSISENVKWGMRQSMRQGNAYVPYKVFLGYDKSPDGTMIINPEQSIIVRRIYCLYLQGLSPHQLGKLFEKEGLIFSQNSPKWHASTIASILRNEKYKGDALRQKTFSTNYLTKERVKNNGELHQYYIHGHHEPIISKELFDAVQKELSQRGNRSAFAHGKHVLSGYIKCNSCGKSYSPITWNSRYKHKRIIWRCCKKYVPGKPSCQTPHFKEAKLKERLTVALNHYICTGDYTLPEMPPTNSNPFCIYGYEFEKSELEAEINKCKKQLIACQDAYWSKRLHLAKDRLEKVSHALDSIRRNYTKAIHMASSARANNLPLETFDERLWSLLVDHAVVYKNDEIMVTFRDGTMVRV